MSVQGSLLLIYDIYSGKIVEKISGNRLLSSITIALVIAVPFGDIF